MSRNLLPMMLTVGAALLTYYLWAWKLGLNENAGLLAAAVAAALTAALMHRFKKN